MPSKWKVTAITNYETWQKQNKAPVVLEEILLGRSTLMLCDATKSGGELIGRQRCIMSESGRSGATATLSTYAQVQLANGVSAVDIKKWRTTTFDCYHISMDRRHQVWSWSADNYFGHPVNKTCCNVCSMLTEQIYAYGLSSRDFFTQSVLP